MTSESESNGVESIANGVASLEIANGLKTANLETASGVESLVEKSGPAENGVVKSDSNGGSVGAVPLATEEEEATASVSTACVVKIDGNRGAGAVQAVPLATVKDQEASTSVSAPLNAVRVHFRGLFVCTETTGFEDFMEEMGVPWLVRKGLAMFSTGHPGLEIIIEGENTMVWNLDNISPSHEFMRKVTAGLPGFDTTDLMGYVCEVKAFWDEDKFVVDLVSKTEGGKGYRVIREVINDSTVLAKMIPNGNQAKQMTRTFSRVVPPVTDAEPDSAPSTDADATQPDSAPSAPTTDVDADTATDAAPATYTPTTEPATSATSTQADAHATQAAPQNYVI